MATKTSLIIKSVNDNNDVVQKAITSVNPGASNVAMKTFAEKVAGLSNHTVKGAIRVDQTDVSDVAKETPELLCMPTCSYMLLADSDTNRIDLSYPGAARPVKLTGHVPASYGLIERQGKSLLFDRDSEDEGESVSDPVLTITLPETDSYNEASIGLYWTSSGNYKAINQEV